MINLNETEDEALAHNPFRFKENCISFSWETIPEGEVYFGQGDYHITPQCKLDRLKHLHVYTPNYAKFACPLYCPDYSANKPRTDYC